MNRRLFIASKSKNLTMLNLSPFKFCKMFFLKGRFFLKLYVSLSVLKVAATDTTFYEEQASIAVARRNTRGAFFNGNAFNTMVVIHKS